MPTSKMVFVPPQPNLGPEPFTEPARWPWVVGAVALALAGVLAWRILRRRKRRKAPEPTQTLLRPEAVSDSPTERMIAWALVIRAAMAAGFGPSWRAKTTEEIAEDATLAGVLGPDDAKQLAAFLEAADRAKFSGPSEPPAHLSHAESSLEALVAKLAAGSTDAGASSRTRGK